MAQGFSESLWEERMWDKLGFPTANAVAYQARGKTIAKKWDENHERFKRIKQRKLGVDDASVIQSALDVGGRVFIAKGEYMLDRTLQIRGIDYLKIVGENRKTIFKAVKSIPNILRQVKNPSKYITIRDIEFDGNDLASIVCYFAGGLKNVIFDNVYIHNSATGFTVLFDTILGTNKKITLVNSRFGYSSRGRDIVGAGGEEFTVTNCVFENDENRVGEGIAIAKARKVFIAFNRFVSPSKGFNGNAIHVEGTCGDIVVIGNYIYQYSGHAIHLTNDVRRAVIVGNIIDATPTFLYAKPASGDIYLLGVKHAIVYGNVIEKSSWQGILCLDVENTMICDNVLIDASWVNVGVKLGDDTNHQRPAILILNTDQANTSKRNIIIANNVIRNIDSVYTNGILVDNQYSYVYIHDNDLTDVVVEKLYCIASNAVVKRNIGYVTENSGLASITGDGTTTQFTIPHGIVSTPSVVQVTPKGGAPMPSVDADATNIILTFATAPASGTTYYYWWKAEV